MPLKKRLKSSSSHPALSPRAMAVRSMLGLVFPLLSSAQGGDYMSQYAAPYQHYMQAGSSGGSGGSGYQQYYKKYMSQYGSGAAGGYEKFMSKYAGDYASKYMPSGSADESSEDAGKPLNFAAAEEDGSSSAAKSKKDSPSGSQNGPGFGKYMDYSKYTQGHGSQGSQAR